MFVLFFCLSLDYQGMSFVLPVSIPVHLLWWLNSNYFSSMTTWQTHKFLAHQFSGCLHSFQMNLQFFTTLKNKPKTCHLGLFKTVFFFSFYEGDLYNFCTFRNAFKLLLNIPWVVFEGNGLLSTIWRSLSQHSYWF